jgi:clan AA aspartic protease (TIGR02281 family)
MKHAFLVMIILAGLTPPGGAEMYKWIDEKGTIYFTDDFSNVPEKYRLETESRKTPEEIPSPEVKEKSLFLQPPKGSGPQGSQGFEVPLLRRHELLISEVILNGRVRRNFIVDTGASFTLISRETTAALDLAIDESTPFIPVSTASSILLAPLVTLKSVQVGNAVAENVEALVHTMPSGQEGLLGNSFLGKFRVVLDSLNGRMTLYSVQGMPTPDRPGGYGREYWSGRFRFFHRILEDLKTARKNYERQGGRSSELICVNNGIRYFEDQLSELERKASFAGVPRNWRE